MTSQKKNMSTILAFKHMLLLCFLSMLCTVSVAQNVIPLNGNMTSTEKIIANTIKEKILPGGISLTVKLLSPNKNVSSILKDQKINASYTDTVSIERSLQSLLVKLYDEGYYIASIDTIEYAEKKVIATLNAGPAFAYFILNKNANMAFADKQLRGDEVLKAGQLKKYFSSILQQLENNGYPFAQVQLVNIKMRDSIIQGDVSITRNEKIIIDSLIVNGNARISNKFLEQYLNIKAGNVYDERLIRGISRKLKNLNFIRETKAVQVTFTKTLCRINVFVESKRASNADGIVGILPPAKAGDKTIVTGDLKLLLSNSAGRGEIIDINWRQPSAKTQRFSGIVSYPYLFHSPVGIDGKIEIFKKDTTFLDVIKVLGVNYILGANNSLKIFVNQRNLSLLNTVGLKNLTTLPDYADVNKTLFGASFIKDVTDYRYSPQRGYTLTVTFAAGKRKIEKNNAFNPELYDSLPLKSNEYKAEIAGDAYFKLMKKLILNVGVTGAKLQTENTFNNELFRFGGLKTLRGFDEESFNANTYIIGKTELRLLLDGNSYLFAFYNQAYYEQRSFDVKRSDTPLGFGAGLAFETKAGIFSFNYALGKQQNNPILFRSAKVHFGIVSAF